MRQQLPHATTGDLPKVRKRTVPEISVVVPTHNRSGWLRTAVRSVLTQQDVDLEAIVVDDGSTDGTGEALAGFGDSRLRLVRHEQPLGVGASRNHGATEARGRWLAFLDDDDLWAPQKLARQLQGARRDERRWSYVGSVNIDEGFRIIAVVHPPPPHEVITLINRRNVIPGGGSNVIVHRDAFEAVGPFDTTLKNTEDWEMWIRLAKHGVPAWVPEPLLAYRVHPTNASLDIAAIFEGVARIERRHGVRTDQGVLHRWIGESCLRTGERARAMKHMALAAVNGEALNVADDARRILERRVRRLLGMRSAPLPVTDQPWIEPARAWLNGLARNEADPKGSAGSP